MTIERQRRGPAWDPARLSQWLSATLDHRPGEIDAPLRVVAAMSSDVLRELWVHIQILFVVTGPPTGRRFRVAALESAPGRTAESYDIQLSAAELEWLETELAARVTRIGVNAVCRRAVALHTDVATLAPDLAAAAGGSMPMSAPLQIFVGDGASLGSVNVSPQWEVARMVATRVRPDPARDPFVRRWYRATVLHQHAGETFDSLQLQRGLALLPDDPMLLFAAGCEREAFAGPVFQEFARQLEDARMRPDFGDAAGELRRAEQYFRRVVDAEPTFTEAAVHLGRVLGLRGQHVEAVGLLTAATDAGGDAFVTYYAALFLGAECEALQRLADAEAAYTRAAQTMPLSRLPHLALAHLARQSGEREDSVDRLRRALGPLPDDPAAEPWYVYRQSHARGAADAMDTMRRLATEAEP